MKKLFLFFFITFLFVLTACNNEAISHRELSLEGEWVRFETNINETWISAVYFEGEFFKTNRNEWFPPWGFEGYHHPFWTALPEFNYSTEETRFFIVGNDIIHNNQRHSFEVSSGGELLFIDSGEFEGTQIFSLIENVLTINGIQFYRVDSDEYHNAVQAVDDNLLKVDRLNEAQVIHINNLQAFFSNAHRVEAILNDKFRDDFINEFTGKWIGDWSTDATVEIIGNQFFFSESSEVGYINELLTISSANFAQILLGGWNSTHNVAPIPLSIFNSEWEWVEVSWEDWDWETNRNDFFALPGSAEGWSSNFDWSEEQFSRADEISRSLLAKYQEIIERLEVINFDELFKYFVQAHHVLTLSGTINDESFTLTLILNPWEDNLHLNFWNRPWIDGNFQFFRD